MKDCGAARELRGAGGREQGRREDEAAAGRRGGTQASRRITSSPAASTGRNRRCAAEEEPGRIALELLERLVQAARRVARSGQRVVQGPDVDAGELVDAAAPELRVEVVEQPVGVVPDGGELHVLEVLPGVLRRDPGSRGRRRRRPRSPGWRCARSRARRAGSGAAARRRPCRASRDDAVAEGADVELLEVGERLVDGREQAAELARRRRNVEVLRLPRDLERRVRGGIQVLERRRCSTP